MKLTDLLKDIELGKVYTDKDNPPFKVNEDNPSFYQGFSSKEAKEAIDSGLKQYSALLRKAQYKIIKDWMQKAKSGVVDYFDLVRGLNTGDSKRAYPYETDFLQKVLEKDKIIDRFRKYYKGKKGKRR